MFSVWRVLHADGEQVFVDFTLAGRTMSLEVCGLVAKSILNLIFLAVELGCILLCWYSLLQFTGFAPTLTYWKQIRILLAMKSDAASEIAIPLPTELVDVIIWDLVELNDDSFYETFIGCDFEETKLG